MRFVNYNKFHGLSLNELRAIEIDQLVDLDFEQYLDALRDALRQSRRSRFSYRRLNPTE